MREEKKTRYSERRVTFMDVGQNSPEVKVFKKISPMYIVGHPLPWVNSSWVGFRWAPEVVGHHCSGRLCLGGRGWALGPNLAPTPERVNTYILNAKQLAEFTFQVKKFAEKVRKLGQHFFARNVRKS